MEVYPKGSTVTASWPEEAKAPFADVIDDPVAWAKKCISQYGADLICVQLACTDPNGMNVGADEAAAIVKQVAAQRQAA